MFTFLFLLLTTSLSCQKETNTSKQEPMIVDSSRIRNTNFVPETNPMLKLNTQKVPKKDETLNIDDINNFNTALNQFIESSYEESDKNDFDNAFKLFIENKNISDEVKKNIIDIALIKVLDYEQKFSKEIFQHLIDNCGADIFKYHENIYNSAFTYCICKYMDETITNSDYYFDIIKTSANIRDLKSPHAEIEAYIGLTLSLPKNEEEKEEEQNANINAKSKTINTYLLNNTNDKITRDFKSMFEISGQNDFHSIARAFALAFSNDKADIMNRISYNISYKYIYNEELPWFISDYIRDKIKEKRWNEDKLREKIDEINTLFANRYSGDEYYSLNDILLSNIVKNNETNNPEIILLLIDKGANPDFYFISEDLQEVINILKREKAYTKGKREENINLLLIAVRYKNIEVAKVLANNSGVPFDDILDLVALKRSIINYDDYKKQIDSIIEILEKRL
jgi:hypothetical protein